jgi:hypothetical protein
MEKRNISFAFVSISTEQFAIIEDNIDKRNSKFNLNSILEFKINKEENMVGVFLTFNFNQKDKVFLKIQTLCNFKIDENSWDELLVEDKIVIPKGYLTHITVLSVGTTRGILHEKTNDSFLNKFVLPTIDVTKLVNADAEFQIIKE